MTVDVRGVNTVNKGAELMLHAILQRSEITEGSRVAVSHYVKGYEYRARLGLFQRLWIPRAGVKSLIYGKIFPRKIREFYGLVNDDDVDIILDASGFAYSSQWGSKPLKEAAFLVRYWRRKGKKVIFLPQAFGPFKKKDIKYIRRVVDNSDLIYARDKDSFRMLTEACGKKGKIRLSPDFTCLTKGVFPEKYDDLRDHVILIPNYRMIDKGNKGKTYYDFILTVVQELDKNNVNYFFLSHNSEDDYKIIEKIQQDSGKTMKVVCESDPLVIKGLIGSARFILSSRFHGIVSSLSQGVPCIGTSWSHKYEALYNDYQIPDLLMINLENTEQVVNIVRNLLDPENLKKESAHLVQIQKSIDEKVMEMWDEVEKCIKQ